MSRNGNNKMQKAFDKMQFFMIEILELGIEGHFFNILYKAPTNIHS